MDKNNPDTEPEYEKTESLDRLISQLYESIAQLRTEIDRLQKRLDEESSDRGIPFSS